MRMPKDAKAALIRSLPLFAECSAREVTQVAAIADEVILPSGRLLTQENAFGREFIVIVRGHARVYRGESTIAKLTRGDFVGEIALLTGQRRTASVVATTDVHALVIEGHAFLRLLEDAPGIRAKVTRAVEERTATAS